MNPSLTPSAYEPRGRRPPPYPRPRARTWSVRHAAGLSACYQLFEGALRLAAPSLSRFGFERLERPVAAVEAGVKGALFDSRMCGECILSATGLSCPMHCPKALRNCPCGGVGADGGCEVYPVMRCVWVEAYEGALRMRGGARLAEIPPPLDQRRKGSSSWLASASIR